MTASLLKSPGLSLVFYADLNNAVVWMISIRPLISKSLSLRTNPLLTVLNVPITIGITVTFMFHSFFSSLARSSYLSLFSLSFSFILWSTGTPKSTIKQVLSFSSFFYWLSRLAEIKWSICISKSQRILCVSFSRTDSGFCIYHLFVSSNYYYYYLESKSLYQRVVFYIQIWLIDFKSMWTRVGLFYA